MVLHYCVCSVHKHFRLDMSMFCVISDCVKCSCGYMANAVVFDHGDLGLINANANNCIPLKLFKCST